jgi:hypothetical protein
MSLEQAMAILADVCRQFRGTLADHNNIQTALTTVGQEIELKRNFVPVPLAPVKPE